MAARASSLLLALALVMVGPAALSGAAGLGTSRRLAEPRTTIPSSTCRTIDHESYRAIAARLPEGQAPRIDGKLDDAIWATAPLQGNFIQREPRFGARASEKTEFRILYDDRNIYIAVWAWDSNPDGILGSELKRDSGLRKGDQIKINFDTFHDHRNAFYFSTNPLGAYKDANSVENGRTINYDWNAVWNNKTSVDDKGWYVEASIPLSQLRFPTTIGEALWGFNVCRIILRKNEEDYWVPFPREWGAGGFARMSGAGVLSGLNDLRARRRMEFVPYLLPTASRDYITQGSPATEAKFGGDFKIGLTNELTADLTYHTDFAQVEADQEVVNLSRFSLFFPERRQFFTESAGIFDYGKSASGLGGDAAAGDPGLLALFYSRRIGLADGQEVPIQAGGRVTGRVGAVCARRTQREHRGRDHSTRRHPDDAERGELHRAARQAQHPQQVEPGRRVPQQPGRHLGLQPRRRPRRRVLPRPESDDHRPAGARPSPRMRCWPTRPAAPIWPASSTSTTRRTSSTPARSTRTSARGSTPRWVSCRGWTSAPRRRRQPTHRGRNGAASARCSTRAQWSTTKTIRAASTRARRPPRLRCSGRTRRARRSPSIDSTTARSFPSRLPAPSSRPASYDWTTVAMNYVSNQGKRVYGSATVNLGGYYDGDRQSVQGAVNFIVGRTLLFEPNYTRNRIVLPGRPIYTSNVVNMRVSHSFSPSLFLKGFAQYNDDRRTASFNFLVWYIYKPGSDLYIVYNQGWDANLPVPQQYNVRNRSLAVKMTYWLAR